MLSTANTQTECFQMTFTAPSFDYYDDGLVHGHEWSRSTPPGQSHQEVSRNHPSRHHANEHDDMTLHTV